MFSRAGKWSCCLRPWTTHMPTHCSGHSSRWSQPRQNNQRSIEEHLGLNIWGILTPPPPPPKQLSQLCISQYVMAIFRWSGQDKCMFQLPSPSLLSNLWHGSFRNVFLHIELMNQSSQTKLRRLNSYIDFDILSRGFTRVRAVTGPNYLTLQLRQKTDKEEGLKCFV